MGMMHQGSLSALTGEASNAVQKMTSGISAWRSTGSTLWLPWYLSNLARAYTELGQFDNASHCIGEAMTTIQTTKERWSEAEVHRIAGEIALKSPGPDVAKAEAYFQRALSVARQQQAKSWELRAAMSMGRLWRDQGKVQQARELLAPVYGWFTEGFDTSDLKEAKALTENSSSGSSGGSPSLSACSISKRARSTAALVSGALYPFIFMSGVMSATCNLICSRRSAGVGGNAAT